jgi:glyceraldehyde 3-phosphate dehydrogenase
LGIMGFGEAGRHLYQACLQDNRIEVVAISDIGKPEILHYLLMSHSQKDINVTLEGNHLVSENGRARMIHGVGPKDVPWDAFDIDFVVDATGKYRKREYLEQHLDSGAKRVILCTLPLDNIDRIAIMGLNEDSIQSTDRLISAGSSTTNATAIMLKTLNDAIGVDYAMLTTIHSYTADQPLRDTAGTDFRRSRSAAENIIPNTTPTPYWIEQIMPEFKGRIEGTALNVPVPLGSLLDLTTVMKTTDYTIDDVTNAVAREAGKNPHLIEVMYDPIVSSDVAGNIHSVVYDVTAAMKTGRKMLKTLSWYHGNLSLATRIKELILAYDNLDKKGGAR